jgi:hypothetical protein
MKQKFKQGFSQGIGIFLGLSFSAVFAYAVTGTIKTWTTGETLTAADLNTTIQSLKTAVESATQYFEVDRFTYQGNTSYATFAGGNSSTEKTSIAPRAGRVKNARLVVQSNTSAGDCVTTLRKNLADTVISFTVPAGSTTTVTDSDTVDIIEGDQLSWRTVCVGTNATQGVQSVVQFEF